MKNIKSSIKHRISIAACALCLVSTAQAEVRINGFANFIAGTSTDAEQFNLLGDVAYDNTVSFNNDSMFALQISADVNSKMTATGQMVARGRNDYQADFEWAYISYQATDELSVSIGRIRAPFFRFSDSSDIGYSYHWLTAPSSVYDVGFTNLNGFRADYNNYAGDWEYNLQVAGGTYKSDFAGGVLSGRDTVVVSAEATYEWFKIRGVWGRATATFSGNEFFDSLLDGIEAGSSLSVEVAEGVFVDVPIEGNAELAEGLRVNDDMGIFLGLGIEADFFDWFVSAEYTSVEQTESFAGTDLAYYVTAGMRVGSFTPSITYEELDGTQSDLLFENVVANISDPTTQAYLAAVNQSVQESAHDHYTKLTATLRYDMDTNTAVKVEISSFTDELDSNFDTTLIRLGVNYVF